MKTAKKTMSETAQDVYKFIKEYSFTNGRLPAVADIARILYMSNSTVTYCLDILWKDGLIIPGDKGGYRDYRVTCLKYVEDYGLMEQKKYFKKVSFETFSKDSSKNGFWPESNAWENIQLPVRQTEGSAGYDFRTPYNLEILPKQKVVVPTGIKVQMGMHETLLMTVRSSIGIRDSVSFPSCVSIIDRDYYNNEANEGDIMLALVNNGDRTVRYKAGERIAQGIILQFETTTNDNASGSRSGGIGSSGR